MTLLFHLIITMPITGTFQCPYFIDQVGRVVVGKAIAE